jgi:hypothetical protein
MNFTGRYINIESFTVILICIVCISGCKNGKSSNRTESSAEKAIIDSTLLFNGKSLDGWEITNFGPQGPVNVSGDQIILGMGEGCTGVTWKNSFPATGYEVSLDAKRVAGNDFFCGITFPVGKSFCSLIVGGWAGTTVGLSSIDGKDASKNETTSHRNFDKDKWYHIRLEVTDEYIKSWIDSDKVVDFIIDNKHLSIRPEVELSKPFGIASWYTTAAIRNIHLTRIKNN